MATITWLGGTSTSWTLGSNWIGGSIPASGDTVVIDNAATVNAPTVDTNQTAAQTNVSANTLTISATLTSPVTVSGIGNLTINASSSIVGATSFGGTGTGTNNGTITGTLAVSGGTFNNAGVVTGATTVSGGTLNVNAGSNLADAQPLTINGGTVNVNATDTVGTLSGTGGTIAFGTGGRLNVNQTAAGTYAGSMSGNFGANVTYF